MPLLTPRLRLGGTLSLALLVLHCAGPMPETETVRVEHGLLAGARGTNPAVRVFKGIPYSAPPVDSLRWRSPQPPAAWSGVRAADRFAPTCMQTPPPEGSFYQVEFFPMPEPMDEDCLYLNVWTAAESADARLPVMVWIHGGGFTQGSGSMPSFDGEALAAEGAVLVTLNYRLGVFGLLAHPALTEEADYGASGNYGLLDQLAALRWVRANIAAFGGDPKRVTLFGQSSGAGNVNTLMASPHAAGLFHRAILQSGSAFAFGRKSPLAEAEQQGQAFADSLGLGSIAALRALPADTLLVRSRGFSFKPVIDGWVLPEAVDRVFARGEQHAVPVLAGTTADEGATLFGPRLNAEIFRALVERRYGAEAEAFLALYPADTDAAARTAFNRSFRDELAWGAETLAGMHVETRGADVYLYHFTRVSPGRDPERYGAFHSSDLVYVFGTLDAVDRPWTPSDRALSELMRAYWTNFAATGDPNAPDLPAWPAFDRQHPFVLTLGDEVGPGPLLEQPKRRFYERQWAAQSNATRN